MTDATSNSTADDAVAGETVIDNGHYAGPSGSEPEEIEPEHAPNDLAGEPIDLSDSE